LPSFGEFRWHSPTYDGIFDGSYRQGLEGYRHMLTDKAVRAAMPEPGNRYRKLSDQGGLYLFCTVDGTRSWRYDYRLAGKRKTLTIGLYPETSLAEARENHKRNIGPARRRRLACAPTRGSDQQHHRDRLTRQRNASHSSHSAPIRKLKVPIDVKADPPISSEEALAAGAPNCLRHGGLIGQRGDRPEMVFLCTACGMYWRYKKKEQMFWRPMKIARYGIV